MKNTTIECRQIAGALGAEVSGVDFSGPVSDGAMGEVREALIEHQAIFFRDQDLDVQQLLATARLFGEPNVYPFVEGMPEAPEVFEIIKTEKDTRNFGGGWHSDSTYLEAPPAYTMLYCREVPDAGGDTIFASSYAGYESLSQGMRDMIDDLQVVNSAALAAGGGRANLVTQSGGMAHTRLDQADEIKAVHPAAPVHPDSGRRSLYVNKAHSVQFVGMTPAESQPIIHYLSDQVTKPEHTCRFDWRAGSLAIWDNRCTQHFAINDYPGKRRHMWRTTVRAAA